jgi:hypothetical protein
VAKFNTNYNFNIAGESAVAPTKGFDVLGSLADVGSSFLDYKTKENNARGEALAEQATADAQSEVLHGFQSAMEQSMMQVEQGVMSSAEANINVKRVMNRYIASNPDLREDIKGMYSNFTGSGSNGTGNPFETSKEAQSKKFVEMAVNSGLVNPMKPDGTFKNDEQILQEFSYFNQIEIQNKRKDAELKEIENDLKAKKLYFQENGQEIAAVTLKGYQAKFQDLYNNFIANKDDPQAAQDFKLGFVNLEREVKSRLFDSFGGNQGVETSAVNARVEAAMMGFQTVSEDVLSGSLSSPELVKKQIENMINVRVLDFYNNDPASLDIAAVGQAIPAINNSANWQGYAYSNAQSFLIKYKNAVDNDGEIPAIPNAVYKNLEKLKKGNALAYEVAILGLDKYAGDSNASIKDFNKSLEWFLAPENVKALQADVKLQRHSTKYINSAVDKFFKGTTATLTDSIAEDVLNNSELQTNKPISYYKSKIELESAPNGYSYFVVKDKDSLPEDEFKYLTKLVTKYNKGLNTSISNLAKLSEMISGTPQEMFFTNIRQNMLIGEFANVPKTLPYEDKENILEAAP